MLCRESWRIFNSLCKIDFANLLSHLMTLRCWCLQEVQFLCVVDNRDCVNAFPWFLYLTYHYYSITHIIYTQLITIKLMSIYMDSINESSTCPFKILKSLLVIMYGSFAILGCLTFTILLYLSTNIYMLYMLTLYTGS